MTIDLRDALEFLAKQARDATGPRTMDVPNGPPHAHYLVGRNGDVQRLESDPTPRRHLIGSLDSFRDMALHLDGVNSAKPAIFLGREKLELVCDWDVRRDHATLPLVLSTPFARLQYFEDGTRWLTQAELIRLLRTDLAYALTDATILPTLRTLRFKKRDDGGTDVQHGKQSIDRSIQQSVMGAGESPLPELLVFHTSVYSTPGFDIDDWVVNVECALDINIEEGTFLLKPCGDTIADAYAATLANVEAWLRAGTREKETPIFVGDPVL
jgi:hypothetical protein